MKKFPVVLILLLATLDVVPMLAQSPKYPPLSEYTMAQDAEIALAKSAAPDYVSNHATIKVFTASGFQTVHEGTTALCAWSCAGLPELRRTLHSKSAITLITTRKPELPFVSTHRPRELYCLITNFGQNWGWKARQPSKLPRGYKPLTSKARSQSAPKCVLPTCGRRTKCLGRRAIGIHISWFTFPTTRPCSAPNTPKALFHPSGTMREQRLRSGLSPSTTNWP